MSVGEVKRDVFYMTLAVKKVWKGKGMPSDFIRSEKC